jgi:hypothetical protein
MGRTSQTISLYGAEKKVERLARRLLPFLHLLYPTASTRRDANLISYSTQVVTTHHEPRRGALLVSPSTGNSTLPENIPIPCQSLRFVRTRDEFVQPAMHL